MDSTHPHRRRITGDDLILVGRLHVGEREAFGELYRRTADPVARYVAARMRERDHDVVDDLVHDAYCDALTDPTLIGPDLLGSLLRLAARACTRHDWSMRRYVRTAHTLYEDRTTSETDSTTAARTVAVLSRVRFPYALARLTPDQRRAIQLRFLDGYPREHAAALMSRSVQAVRSLEQRALRRLQATCTA